MEIEGITWYDAAIDSEPAREKDATEKRMEAHMDRCADCSYPRHCAILEAIARNGR